MTHGNAANFLQTMKTLMAKLKVRFLRIELIYALNT